MQSKIQKTQGPGEKPFTKRGDPSQAEPGVDQVSAAAAYQLLARSAARQTLQPAHWVSLQHAAGNRAVAGIVARKTAPPVQRDAVNPTPVARLDRTALLGDGTPGNPGTTLGTFRAYITTQADWFVEPTLTAADRDLLWKLVLMLQGSDHIGTALARVTLADLGATAAADMVFVRAYAEGAKSVPSTVRIVRPDASIARVIQLGKAMVDLATFVPSPVLRICIDQTGLETLVDNGLVPVLSDYYKDFSPTIENPAEQGPLLALLRTGLAPFAPLKDWVHDLHVFTPATRNQLVTNVADKGRTKPVLLVLMSGLDWNAAFFQAANLEAAVLNNKNLALVIQGAKSLADETVQLNKVADDYGQIPAPGAKARLGQVVIAGHGASTLVEQTTPGTGAVSGGEKYVSYNQAQIHPVSPGDDSERLIDALLLRMDPAAARVVFAGCLVGSHDVPETPTLSNVGTASAEINAALKANPNLRDLVNQRMAALKIKGTVQAANASTTFSAFNLDAAGKAQLSLGWDRDIGGPKAAYVKTGIEPEGALRAALETWADPALGPAWTTQAMRDHVAAIAARTEWWASITRTAFTIALPPVGTNVKPDVIANLAHRVEPWLLAGWDTTANAGRLARAVKPAEAPVLYPVMMASDRWTTFPHLPLIVQQAWMQVDAAREADFLAAIGATTFTRTKLTPMLDAGLIDPHLPTLLTTATPATPSRAQLFLALTLAISRGAAMPLDVRNLLRSAAGGVSTITFPAALGVPALLDGASELGVLRDIGLAPGAPPPVGSPPVPDDANADLNKDKTNETFISVSPRETIIAGLTRSVRKKPGFLAMPIGSLKAGDVARVVGMTAGWTAIDFNGKIGFVHGALP